MTRNRLRARHLYYKYNHSLPNPLSDIRDLEPGETPGAVGQNGATNPCAVMGAERTQLLAELLQVSPESLKGEFEPPLYVDYGHNIKLEGAFYANWNAHLVDVAEIRIGDGTLLGPNVHLYTATHSINAKERAGGGERALPIRIGRDSWLGGNTTVMPGVTIGDNVVIGAGSVVTSDIPSFTVAVGCPAKVIKHIKPEERTV